MQLLFIVSVYIFNAIAEDNQKPMNKNIQQFERFDAQGRYRSGSTAAIIDDPIFSKYRIKLEHINRNCIRIVPDVKTTTFPVGVSKFGGNPDLPLDVSWPSDIPVLKDRGRVGEELIQSMPFICQVNLEELRPYDKDNLLPIKGMLYFFYKDPIFDQRQAMRLGPGEWNVEQSERFLGSGRCKVIYVEAPGKLISVEYPNNLPTSEHSPAKYRQCRMAFRSESNVPAEINPVLRNDGMSLLFSTGGVEITEDDADAWAELSGAIRGELFTSQLLGYADRSHRIQSGLHWFEEVQNYQASDELKKVALDNDVCLLLQLSVDISFFTDIPVSSRMYFFIRGVDLKRRDFSHVWWSCDP
ncbi:MAG: DUF1963 domain-containing protein [Verrucomicrobiae bacterium]|nr:DUF1963 domain-containing protein [Verrucomicrobiae bacterium]